MKIFIPHIIVFSGRTKKAPKPVQREFERAGKGEWLVIFIVVRLCDKAESFSIAETYSFVPAGAKCRSI